MPRHAHPSAAMPRPLFTALWTTASLLGATVVPIQGGRAQALAPMVGASAIQGTLQGTSMPATTGVLDKARSTVNGARGPAPATPTTASPTQASGSPSGASVNGQPIPLCSHGGLCQGALMRGMGRP